MQCLADIVSMCLLVSTKVEHLVVLLHSNLNVDGCLTAIEILLLVVCCNCRSAAEMPNISDLAVEASPVKMEPLVQELSLLIEKEQAVLESWDWDVTRIWIISGLLGRMEAGLKDWVINVGLTAFKLDLLTGVLAR